MFERELHDECKNRSVSQDYLITSNRQGNYWFVVLAAFGRIENPERPLEAQSLLNFIMAALIFPSPGKHLLHGVVCDYEFPNQFLEPLVLCLPLPATILQRS